jgi:hypothetical protein
MLVSRTYYTYNVELRSNLVSEPSKTQCMRNMELKRLGLYIRLWRQRLIGGQL